VSWFVEVVSSLRDRTSSTHVDLLPPDVTSLQALQFTRLGFVHVHINLQTVRWDSAYLFIYDTIYFFIALLGPAKILYWVDFAFSSFSLTHWLLLAVGVMHRSGVCPSVHLSVLYWLYSNCLTRGRTWRGQRLCLYEGRLHSVFFFLTYVKCILCYYIVSTIS